MAGRAKGRARWAVAGLALLALTVGACTGGTTGAPERSPGTGEPAVGVHDDGVRVEGARFVASNGATVRLRGFNHSGAEYSCVAGWGVFDAPGSTTIAPDVVAAMARWQGANAVRIPLNEQCWLGINGVRPAYGGAAYQTAIADLVAKLAANGLLAILDLHLSAPGGELSPKPQQMPDRDHSVEFWRQVAQRFGANSSVLFDLFNEPVPFGEADSDRAWQCWRDGGCLLTSVNSGASYVAAGMNELISAIRSTGARNVVLAGGINWAETLTRWLAFRPTDPLRNLAAALHAYSFNTDCASPDCYRRVLAPLATRVPLLVGEIGPDLTIGYDQAHAHCAPSDIGVTGFDAALFDWMDRSGVSYTAWTWNTWPSCWALVRDWSGTPTSPWGEFLRQRLARPG